MANDVSTIADLFTQLEARMFSGNRLKSREFVVLANPGQFLSQELDESKVEDLFIQSELTNTILDCSYIYKPLISSLDQKYWDIVDFAELPQKTLTQAQEKEIEAHEAWLEKYMEVYLKYQNQYQDAVDQYESEKNSPSPQEHKLKFLKQRMDDAFTRWTTIGKKDEYDRRSARIRYLNARDPNVYWEKLRQEKESLRRVADKISFYEARLYPRVNSWGKASWTTVSFGVKDHSTSNKSTSTDWSGGVSAGWGLWSVGADANGSTVDRRIQSSTRNFSISFECLRVRIIRPWLRDNIFSLGSWRWDRKVHNEEILSDGGKLDVNPPHRPLGSLPMITRELLVARNLTITADFSSSDDDLRESHFKSAASVGWGPFSLKGSYKKDNVEHKVDTHWEGETISVKEPQVIGYFCTLLPKSPDPDPTLAWETVREFMPDKEYLRLRARERAEEAAVFETYMWLKERTEEIEERRAEQDAILEREAEVKRERLAADSIEVAESEIERLTGESARHEVTAGTV